MLCVEHHKMCCKELRHISNNFRKFNVFSYYLLFSDTLCWWVWVLGYLGEQNMILLQSVLSSCVSRNLSLWLKLKTSILSKLIIIMLSNFLSNLAFNDPNKTYLLAISPKTLVRDSSVKISRVVWID